MTAHVAQGGDVPGYELRVEGHLDDHWSTWFGSMILRHENDGTTTLRGPVSDQAELHGLIAKVRDLGAPLISVTPTTAAYHADSQPARDRQVRRPAEPAVTPPGR